MCDAYCRCDALGFTSSSFIALLRLLINSRLIELTGGLNIHQRFNANELRFQVVQCLNLLGSA